MRRHGTTHTGLRVTLALLMAGSALVSLGHEENAVAKAQEKSHRMGGAVWGANFFPNVPLETQDGKSVRFFDDLIKDKVVLINLIYTSCEASCPLMTARMAKTGSPPVGWRLFLGEDFPVMAQNQVRNVTERRIRTVSFICAA